MDKLQLIIILVIAFIILAIFGAGILIGAYGFKAVLWILVAIGVLSILRKIFI